MAEQDHGCIVNIASLSALRPLTRIPAYSEGSSGKFHSVVSGLDGPGV